MDVRIKLSLAGGHSWEFVCDEDDPTVSGIVSALPGANVDAALPPDGLIQVESRSGERLFLTRTSLVSVSIQRLSSPDQSEDGDERRRLRPADFIRLPDLLSPQAVGEIVQPGAVHGVAPGAATELELAALPPAVVDLLIAVAAQAAGDLDLEVEGPSHLDVRLFGAAAGASFSMPDATAEQLLLLIVPLADPLMVRLADQTLSKADLREQDGRDVRLAIGEGLAVAQSAAAPTIVCAADGPAIILVTSLCRGDARAP